MTVKNKLISSSIILLVLFVFICATMLLGYRNISRQGSIAEQLNKGAIQLERLLRGLNEVIINEGSVSSVKTVRSALDEFESIHKNLLLTAGNSEIKKMLADIYPAFNHIRSSTEPFLAYAYIDFINDEGFQVRYGAMLTNTEKIIKQLNVRADGIKAEISSKSKQITYLLLLSFLITLSGIIGLFFKLHKSITYPIEELVAIAEGFNRGDLSIMMDESRKDEFGDLARLFNKSTTKLNTTTGKLHESSNELEKLNKQLQAEIVEREEVQTELRRIYKMTMDILGKAPFGIYLINSQGVIEYINQAMLDISGETHKQLSTLNVFELPTYINSGLTEKIKDVMNGNPFSMGPIKYTSNAGKKTTIRNFIGIPYKEDSEHKALVFVEDLTELEKTREALFSARHDWEDTFNSITDMITIHDKDFNIIGANEAAKKILDLPESKVCESIKCYKQFHGTDAPPEGCPSCNCLKTAEPAIFDIFEPHLNTYIEVRSIPRFDNNNQLIGLIHVCRDIAQRKHDEEMIRIQLNRLSGLRSIDKAILGSIDIRAVLDIFLDQVRAQLKTDAASVLLLNSKTHILEYVHSKGFRSGALKHTKLRLGDSNAGRAAIERRIISISNLREHPDSFAPSTEFEHEHFVSYLAVPLIAKGNVKGVLEVFHRSEIESDPDWMEFLEAIADQGAIAIDNSTMFDDLQRSNVELSIAYDKTIEGWSRAMDMRDKETEGHSQRVTEMTMYIAAEMGLKDDDLVHIRRGALLHDMGKLGIPDNILLKPGELTDSEWMIMKQHPEFAYEMLYPIEHLRPALDIPYYHHEKWDGTGYPRGVKGKEIPIAARIFALVDVWDALRSDRPYRSAWPEEKAIQHIRSLAGTHFDPEVVDVFFRVIRKLYSEGLPAAADREITETFQQS